MNDRLPSHPVAHLGWFLLLLLALTPTHTKIAGLLWLLTCLIAAVIAWRSPVLASDESVRGARRWLMACLASLALVLMVGRFDLLSYPLPWSASVGILIMLVFPIALLTAHGSRQGHHKAGSCAIPVLTVHMA